MRDRTSFWNANTHYHDVVLAALLPGAANVLDVGCGDGVLLADLVAAGVARVVGIDIDDQVLSRARQRLPALPIEWMHDDVLTSDLPPRSFDAVVSVASLHHMDAARALQRFAELVRPGGAVIIIGLARADWWELPLDALSLGARVGLSLFRGHWQHSAKQCWPPPLTYREMKILGPRLLPGAAYRRHLLGRYSLVWRKPAS